MTQELTAPTPMEQEVRNNRSLASSFTSRRKDKDIKFQIERDYALQIIRNAERRDNTNPFKNCHPATLSTSLLDLAATGLTLSPRLSLAYLIPYGNTITLEISYRGMEHMCYRSGLLKQLNVDIVRKGDHFQERHTDVGPGFEHIPLLHEGSGKDGVPPIIAAYCMAHFTNGGRHYQRIDRDVFERAKKASVDKNKGKVTFLYRNWEEEAWKKICVRRAWKHWPKDAAMAETIDMVERHSEPVDFGPPADEVVSAITISVEQADELRQMVRDAFPNDEPEQMEKRVDFWMDGIAESMHVSKVEDIPEPHLENARDRIQSRIDAIQQRRSK